MPVTKVPAITLSVPKARPKAPPKPRKPEKAHAIPVEPAPTANAQWQRERYARSLGEEVPVATIAAAPEVITDPTALSDDLAATVAKRTLRRLAAGELEPSLRDGLIAQQLLDRRAEKAADRSFMLSLAQALAGGGYTAPPQLLPGAEEPPEDIEEGYFEEIPLAPDHLRAD